MSAAAEIAAALGGKPKGSSGWIARCPCHMDNKPSLSIDEGNNGTVLLHCFAGCRQEELVAWVRDNGHDLGGRRLIRRAPIPEKSGSQRWSPAEPRTQQRERLPAHRILATFDYRDADGNLSYQVVRWNPKTFKQRQPGPNDDRGNDTWIENIEGITSLPYRLPQLLAAPDETVFICEGEKDADRLAKEGLVATTNSGGAGKVEIWAQLAKANWLKDRRVVLIPDNDESGRTNVPCVARALTGVAASIRVLTLPGLKEKGDVSDWLDVGGTIDEFCRLAHEAPLWDPAFDGGDGEDPDDKEIARLAALTRIKYGKERKEAAKELGVSVAILDAAVAEKRAELFPKDDNGDGQGRRLEFVDNAPWDEEVEGAELLDSLDAGLAKYVILTPHQRHALALYTVFDYAFAAFEHNPKIVVTSAAKRSGKTRLLRVLERLLARPLLISGINPTALLRVIEIYGPSILLDEYDALVRSGKEMAEAMRGLLNSGFDKAAARDIKLVPTEDGWEPRAFSTWCPQVIAGIGDVPETVADRSVRITMIRKLRTENVARLRERDGADLSILARQAARWAEDHLEELEEADPAMPEELNDRAADAWSPLLAIADAVGGKWRTFAREAAIALSGGEDTESSIPLMLLADIKRALDRIAKDEEGENKHRIASDDLVEALTKMRDRPWPEYGRGKGLTQHSLAHLLKPFAITPAGVRFGTQVRKGYHRRQFREAWVRYLDLDPNKLPLDADDAANDDDVAAVAATPSAKVYSFGEKVRHNLRRNNRSRGENQED